MAASASAASCPAAVLAGARTPSPVAVTARPTVRCFSPPRLYFSSKLLHLDSQSQDLKAKWDSLEDKPTVLLYGGGALVAVWLSSVVVGAINSVPLLPKLLELVGLGYTGWFVYRYLLFKERRKELASDIEDLKKKIAGSGE